ncbi:MAG: type IV secretory system conjugative DNA transfer family protein, partial [Rhizomicrobium sp.]
VYKDNWETFLANSGLKVFFNLEDHFSREYVSKLIGETEVIREVRSASDSTSESESFSRSVTHSESETRGRSASTGTSESEGTNSGRSWGINSSESRSQNYSYAQGIIFRHYDNQKIGDSRSQSRGESKGWSEGKSRGTSRSRTDGTSESTTTGTSETTGETHGTSQSRTEGTSETIQKRALITPDEIGQVFARIDERAHQAYPGLALVVISGARPVAVRRVNYYEDYEFAGLFDPPPDYPYTPPKQLTVEGRTLGLSLATFGLRLGGWTIKAGQITAAGDEGALVVKRADGTEAAHIRVPRDGKITKVEGEAGGDVPDGPLFSLLYYDDGAAAIDPFAEVRAFCDQLREALAARQREAAAEKEKRKAEDRKRRIRKYAVMALVACCVLVGIIWAMRTMRPAALMVGKIDVSHFAGLKPGDTEARVASLYGQPSRDFGTEKLYGDTYITVEYKNGLVSAVAVDIRGLDTVRSRVGSDPLLDLLGHSKADVLALLGPPKRSFAPSAQLFWNFSMPGRPAKEVPDTGYYQTLLIQFNPENECIWVNLLWTTD